VSAATQVSAKVLSNRRLTHEMHALKLRLPEGWGPALPGQFVQLECPPRVLFGLRRPFSLAGCRPMELGTEVDIVYGAVGLHTRGLAEVRAGEVLELVGPLGRPFTPVPLREPVLVGGGRGIAPLLMLADAWKTEFPYGTILYGARTSDQLMPLPDPPYTVHLATEDGTAGVQGDVIQLLQLLFQRGEIRPTENALFGCGPNRMLAAMAAWAGEQGFSCQVSLETHFGCGFGICAGCAVPVRPEGAETAQAANRSAFERYALACKDGPVMDASRVEWEGLPG
jgi:dihydroorotate dehydrogenase electron transfer subunit